MAKKVLMKGNEALAEAAIRAGCKIYVAYPITPQSEIPHYMAKELPKRDGVFIQAASEIEVISMVYGASAAGARAMTSSSSPGISLMQEGISYLACAQLPCLIVNMMRGGPGLGDISPSQSDYFQATRGGGHGDYRVIVLAPSTVQEIVDMPELAFELAEKYRIPAMILGDGALGQMAEPILLNKKNHKKTECDKSWIISGAKDRPVNKIVPFDLDPAVIEKLNWELQEKYEKIQENEVRLEIVNLNNPDIICVAYGIVGRIMKTVIKKAGKKGIKVALIRPITLWPFPSKIIEGIAKNYDKKFLTVEMSCGQMVEDVKLAVNGKREVLFYGRPGGIIPTAEEILENIEKILGKKEEVKSPQPSQKSEVRPSDKLSTSDDTPPPGMEKVYSRPKCLTDKNFTYCPGCGHSIVHRLIAEVIDELNIREKTIGIFPIGCAVMGYEFFNFDAVIPAHGRAPAVATGIKRIHPDKIVFAYQGDGDLAAIGLVETVHTANRGENITVLFINNANYAMTGGQMAPTTLPGQITTTTPEGRNPQTEGEPISICEILSQFKRPAYIARVTVTSPKEIIKAKKAIKKAFQNQLEGKGYSLVEVLSPCPINWRLEPIKALKWIEDEMLKFYPLGEFKNSEGGDKK